MTFAPPLPAMNHYQTTSIFFLTPLQTLPGCLPRNCQQLCYQHGKTQVLPGQDSPQLQVGSQTQPWRNALCKGSALFVRLLCASSGGAGGPEKAKPLTSGPAGPWKPIAPFRPDIP